MLSMWGSWKGVLRGFVASRFLVLGHVCLVFTSVSNDSFVALKILPKPALSRFHSSCYVVVVDNCICSSNTSGLSIWILLEIFLSLSHGNLRISWEMWAYIHVLSVNNLTLVLCFLFFLFFFSFWIFSVCYRTELFEAVGFVECTARRSIACD